MYFLIVSFISKKIFSFKLFANSLENNFIVNSGQHFETDLVNFYFQLLRNKRTKIHTL